MISVREIRSKSCWPGRHWAEECWEEGSGVAGHGAAGVRNTDRVAGMVNSISCSPAHEALSIVCEILPLARIGQQGFD